MLKAFLAVSMTEDGLPHKVFVCPIFNKDEIKKTDPFPIFDVNSNDSLNLAEHKQIELHLMNKEIIITASKDGEALVYRIDFNEGINRAKFSCGIVGLDQANQHIDYLLQNSLTLIYFVVRNRLLRFRNVQTRSTLKR